MTSDLVFGPPGDQWRYDRATKMYDLTRGSTSAFTLATSHGPGDTRISIDPGASVLIIVDMQNFFLHPSCRDHPTGLAAVEPTLAVMGKCHDLGVQIIFLNWSLTETDLLTMPASIQRGFARSLIAPEAFSSLRPGLGADLGSGRGRCLMAGEWNTELYAPLAAAARADDVHCAKNRLSGTWNADQPLVRHLREWGKRTLLFAGVNTDQCVFATLVDAAHMGWDCVLVEDCSATLTDGGKEVVVGNVTNTYGFVVNSKTFMDGKFT